MACKNGQNPASKLNFYWAQVKDTEEGLILQVEPQI